MILFRYLCLMVLTWAFMGAVFTGLAAPVRRLFGLVPRRVSDLLILPWIGWCSGIAILQVWHLFLPIDDRARGLVVVLGLLGLVIELPVVVRVAWRGARGNALFLAVLLVAAFWLANHTAVQHTIYDSGFYHLSAVRWIETYAAVPGLANLSKMLGFNDAYFLYVALMDAGPFALKVHHIAGSFLILLVLMRLLAGGRAVLLQAGRAASWQILDALLLVYILTLAMGMYGASHSPDLAVYVLGVTLGSELLRLLEACSRAGRGDDASPSADDEQRRRECLVRVWTIIFIATTGVTLKLNLAFFAATVSLLALGAYLRRWPGLRSLEPVRCAGVLVLVVAVLLPWAARGVILSGYIGYPSAAIGFPVDWRVPAESAQAYVREIAAWARQPFVPDAQRLPGWAWLWPWLNELMRASYDVVTPLMLALVGAPLVAWAGRYRSAIRGEFRLLSLILILPAVHLVFWFCMAPDVRFAGADFWLLAAGALALALRRHQPETTRAVLVVFTLVSLAMNFNPLAFVIRWQRDMGPERSGPLTTMTTDSGLVVNVPVEGFQVWRAPLPATPYFNPNLRLRVPGDLSRGFTVQEP